MSSDTAVFVDTVCPEYIQWIYFGGFKQNLYEIV